MTAPVTFHSFNPKTCTMRLLIGKSDRLRTVELTPRQRAELLHGLAQAILFETPKEN